MSEKNQTTNGESKMIKFLVEGELIEMESKGYGDFYLNGEYMDDEDVVAWAASRVADGRKFEVEGFYTEDACWSVVEFLELVNKEAENLKQPTDWDTIYSVQNNLNQATFGKDLY